MYAFNGCSSLKSITIPNSITTIADGNSGFGYTDKTRYSGVFSHCTALASVTLSENLTKIGSYAFYGCTSLTSIEIPSSVTSIGEKAFHMVPNVVYNGSAENSPWGAKNVNGYTEGYLIYTDQSKSILLTCSNAAQGFMSIPNGVEQIKANAFADCVNIFSVNVPASVIDIEQNAFKRLPNVEYQGSATGSPWGARCVNGYIDEYLVYKNSSKTDLVACLPTATKVIIPNSVVSVESTTFQNCVEITSLTVGTNVTSFNAYLHWCSKLHKIYWNAKSCTSANVVCSAYGETSAYPIYCPIDSFIVGEGVETLPNYLCNSSSLEIPTTITLILPSSVLSISDEAFLGANIHTINYIGTIEGWCNLSYKPRNTQNYKLQLNGVLQTNITIPNNITKIRDYAFYGCTSLTSVTIPGSITHIGQGAFRGCANLNTVKSRCFIPPTLGEDAFSQISTKSLLMIPQGSQTLYQQDAQWSNFATIKTFRCPLGINGLYYMLNAENNEAELTRESSDADSYKTVQKVQVPESVSYQGVDFAVTSISDSAFVNCTSLNVISLPSEIRTIGRDVFKGCTGLNAVEWNIRSCGDFSSTEEAPFYSIIKNIQSFTFGKDVQYIPAYLCDGMTSLKGIGLQGSLISIGNYAFANIANRKFNSIIFPHSVTTIGKHAFDNDIYLENIEFGDNMEYIQDSAFLNCTRVMTMTSWSEFTPNVGKDAISSIKSSAELYVRSSCLRKYQMDDNWSRFVLKEIGADETTVSENQVTVVPEDNTALFTWPTNTSADTYTLTITKDGVVFCTLVFNANGQLAGIAFAPGRNGAPHGPAAELTSVGMQFTVTGLNIATIYGFDLAVKDTRAQVLASYSGQFGTTGAYEAIDNIEAEQKVSKRLENGQLLLERGEHTYTLTGQKIK